MALNSTWWSTNWADVKWEADFSSMTHWAWYNDAAAGTNAALYKYVYKVALCNNSGSGSSLGNYGFGTFYLEEPTRGQKQFFDGVIFDGLYQSSPIVSSDSSSYPCPFHDSLVEFYSRPYGPGPSDLRLYWNVNSGTGASESCDLMYYQPDVYHGFAGRVIAAILIDKGLSAAYIDQTSFSDADDGQDSVSGDFLVFVRRKVGQTVADTVKSVARHTWDLLSINMAGKVALCSRNNIGSTHTLASIGHDDGIVDVKWTYAMDKIANSANAIHGEYVREHGSFANVHSSSSHTYGSEKHLTPDDSTSEWLFDKYEDTASVTQLGEIQVESGDFDIVKSGETKNVRYWHLPYFPTYLAKNGFMARLSAAESTPRRELTVVQGLHGLDYDVGYKISSVALTGDGGTFTAFCTRKTIDFNDLSVTSVLLEEPT